MNATPKFQVNLMSGKVDKTNVGTRQKSSATLDP